MRRFFKQVSVVEGKEGFAVFLDSRPLKNMAGGGGFFLPSRAAAELVAEEWRTAADEFDPRSMPVTRLTMGAEALNEEDRRAVIAKMLEAAKTDVLCFFASYPEELVRRQEKSWRPWVERINAQGCDFDVRRDLSVSALSENTSRFLSDKLEAEKNVPLACLQILSGLFGSVILALAVRDGALSAKEAFALSRLEETFQNEQWPADGEALRVRETREGEALLAEKVLFSYGR